MWPPSIFSHRLIMSVLPYTRKYVSPCVTNHGGRALNMIHERPKKLARPGSRVSSIKMQFGPYSRPPDPVSFVKRNTGWSGFL